MKKIIERQVCAYDLKYAYKASEWVLEIQKLISTYGDGNIEIEEHYDGCYEIIFYYESEETEEEYQSRLEKEKRLVDKERQEYERLKAKFGG